MADIVTFVQEPNSRELAAAFKALPDDLRDLLEEKFAPLLEALLGDVLAREPTPKTGSLRDATDSYDYNGRNKVGGGIAIGPENGEPFNVKAAALEFGAHKYVKVDGHDMRLDHFMNKQIEPMTVFRNAYRRNANIIALHYMRDALAARQPDFVAAVNDAISALADDFNK